MGLNIRINEINLINYRNHKKIKLKINKNIIFLYGKNGVGKTNILEAISHISSPSGFRNSKISDIHFRKVDFLASNFGINISLTKADQNSIDTKVGIGLINQLGKLKRIIKINGQKTNIKDLQKKIKVFWILPNMINLFNGFSIDRRNFLDSMISILDYSHHENILLYNKLQRERLRVLKSQYNSEDVTKWLDTIEKKIVPLGVIICDARRKFILRVNEHSLEKNSKLPVLKLILTGEIDTDLSKSPALSVEEKFLEKLKNNREKDLIIGKTHYGINKTDLEVMNLSHSNVASNSSTGEQKIILISIVFLFLQIIKQTKSMNIIFLLDDIFAHLDKSYIDILIDELMNIKIQTWISNVNKEFFSENENFLNEILFLNIKDI